mmetsp:Transcript_61337/g.150942  ORF Transcript_61337/g.150942 Transcript_61337/m.150942 type:complete len:375 (-) Transcript_61337:6-1130(-)
MHIDSAVRMARCDVNRVCPRPHAQACTIVLGSRSLSRLERKHMRPVSSVGVHVHILRGGMHIIRHHADPPVLKQVETQSEVRARPMKLEAALLREAGVPSPASLPVFEHPFEVPILVQPRHAHQPPKLSTRNPMNIDHPRKLPTVLLPRPSGTAPVGPPPPQGKVKHLHALALRVLVQHLQHRLDAHALEALNAHLPQGYHKSAFHALFGELLVLRLYPVLHRGAHVPLVQAPHRPLPKALHLPQRPQAEQLPPVRPDADLVRRRPRVQEAHQRHRKLISAPRALTHTQHAIMRLLKPAVEARPQVPRADGHHPAVAVHLGPVVQDEGGVGAPLGALLQSHLQQPLQPLLQEVEVRTAPHPRAAAPTASACAIA